MNVRKFREYTDQARLTTLPTRKSPGVNRPEGTDACVIVALDLDEIYRD
jgi:hypothetical protein